MVVPNQAALWAATKAKQVASVQQAPRYPCVAFNSNPIVEVVCRRVTTQPAGNREYCVAHNCQSPWRFLPAGVVATQASEASSVAEDSPQEPAPPKVRAKHVPRGIQPRGTVNLQALQEAAETLRLTKQQLTQAALVAAAAPIARKKPPALKAFFQSLPVDTQQRLLYGEGGKKVSRSDEKFSILLRVREEIRAKGEKSPSKKQLAVAAASDLKLTPGSAYNYVCSDLAKEQVRLLDLAEDISEKYLATLKKVRVDMRARGLPTPRRMELARAAAVVLEVSPSTLKAFMQGLSPQEQKDLGLSTSHSRVFSGIDPLVIREGFIAVVAVLRLKRKAPTVANLQQLLDIDQKILDEYFVDNPDILALFMQPPAPA